jgi:signal transduction histidine kinase
VYGKVKKDILVLIWILFLVAFGTGLYTLQANRKTFERLHHLAERLQTQSEQLSRLSWKLIEVQEDTLKRVARDLHDEFGQILTAIGSMLSRAEQKGLDKNSIFIQEVQKVRKIVAETLESVRDSSQIFRPAILDDFGLEQTLEWFVGQFSRQTGIQVHFERQLSEGFYPREDAIHIYRILQEALNNVARHAKAQEAWVTLRENGDELALEVRDNGVGFAASPELGRAPGDGIGLMGMKERAQHLNGTFTIRSAPGKGTVVKIRIPIDRNALRSAAEKVG